MENKENLRQELKLTFLKSIALSVAGVTQLHEFRNLNGNPKDIITEALEEYLNSLKSMFETEKCSIV